MDTLTQTLENIPGGEETTETKDICIKLWKEFCSQKITQSELQKELAYVTISPEHGWNELKRKSSPTKPVKLVEYLRDTVGFGGSRQFEKKIKLQEEVFQDMRVVEYFLQLSRVQAENMKTVHRLREIKDVFDREGDIASRGKVQMRIQEFLLDGGEVRYEELS